MNYTKITISGKICTGKTTLFENLQKKLNWPIFSTSQYFRKLAKTKKFSLEKAEEQNETITKEVDYRVRDLLLKNDNIITEGWMTGIMANDYPNILKILLVCDNKVRSERFSRREKISIGEAETRIRNREDNLFKKLSQIYKRDDFLDPQNYNHVINTSNLNSNEVLKIVLAKLGINISS